MGKKYDEKQDIYSLKVSSQRIFIKQQVETDNFTSEKPGRHHLNPKDKS